MMYYKKNTGMKSAMGDSMDYFVIPLIGANPSTVKPIAYLDFYRSEDEMKAGINSYRTMVTWENQTGDSDIAAGVRKILEFEDQPHSYDDSLLTLLGATEVES